MKKYILTIITVLGIGFLWTLNFNLSYAYEEDVGSTLPEHKPYTRMYFDTEDYQENKEEYDKLGKKLEKIDDKLLKEKNIEISVVGFNNYRKYNYKEYDNERYDYFKRRIFFDWYDKKNIEGIVYMYNNHPKEDNLFVSDYVKRVVSKEKIATLEKAIQDNSSYDPIVKIDKNIDAINKLIAEDYNEKASELLRKNLDHIYKKNK